MNFLAKRPGLKVIRSSTRVGSLGVLTPIRGHVRIDKESVGPQLAEQPEPRTGSRCAFLYFQGQGFGKRNRSQMLVEAGPGGQRLSPSRQARRGARRFRTYIPLAPPGNSLSVLSALHR
jgi:hypothetical protein